MTFLFAGALVLAGRFTRLPGRIMHAVGFGHQQAPKTRPRPA
jgi:uncharacterized membrane protein